MSETSTASSPLRGHVNRLVPRKDSKDMVLAQVGWLGQSGNVYALDDPPYDAREPGSFGPLYIQLGTWEPLAEGRWGIRD